jgi:hypothetical protein
VLNIQLTDIPAVLVGLYATEFALITLSILLTAFLSWSRPIPSLFDASKLGRLPRLLGFAAKSLPRLLVAFHYLILLLVVVLTIASIFFIEVAVTHLLYHCLLLLESASTISLQQLLLVLRVVGDILQHKVEQPLGEQIPRTQADEL